MIAMVPDPKQTHFALGFDRVIEALQLAAVSMDYVIDRYWLPWDVTQRTDWADYDSFKEAMKDQKLKEAQPGLLMFRLQEKGETSESVLYVFLVGETPTAGVNGEQFANALEYISELNADKPAGCNHKACFHVVGPIFSGSVDALHRLVAEQGPPDRSFVFHSGTVLAVERPELRDQSKPFFFESYLNPAITAVSGVIGMLQNDSGITDQCKNPEQHEVAILTEAASVLGGEFKEDPAHEHDPTQCFDIYDYSREIASLRNAYKASTGQNQAPGSNAPVKHPSLSVNLTDVTNSSDEPPDFSQAQSPLSKEAALMGFAAEMRRKRYKYIGIISTNELDVVFLINFLRSAVPDARPFLIDSDLLLQHEPDNGPYMGTFAVTTYPLFPYYLNPLSEPDPAGKPKRKRTRLPFSTQFEEGVYNAMVCGTREILGDNKKDLGYLSEREKCPSTPPLWVTTFGAGGRWPIEVLPTLTSAIDAVQDPKLKDLPAAWKTFSALLFVFAGLHVLVLLGLWPFSPKFSDFILGTVAPLRRLVGIQAASATLALALWLTGLSAWKADGRTMAAGSLLGAFFVACLLLTCWHVWRRREAPTQPGDTSAAATDAKPGRWVTLLIVTLWTILLAAALWANGISLTLVKTLPTPHRWTLAAGSLIGALFATCLLLMWGNADWYRIAKRSEPPPIRQNLLILLPWGLTVVPAGLWWKLVRDTGGHYGAYFSYRAVHLASDVSPLMALLPLLAAIYLAAIFYVWHLRFNDKVRPRLFPNPGEGKSKAENSGKGLARIKAEDKNHQDETKKLEEDPNRLRPGLRSERRIADAINTDWRNLAYGFTIFLVWLFVFRPLRFELFERSQFQCLYKVLFSLVILLILISGFRLNRIWERLRQFLMELNRQRVRHVFSQLESEDWSSIWFYGAENADWDYMHRSHEILQRLWEFKDEDPKEPGARKILRRLARIIRWTAAERVVLNASREADKAVRHVQRRRWNLQKRLEKSSLGKLLLHRKTKRSYEKLETEFNDAQDYLAAVLIQALDQIMKHWREHPLRLHEDDEVANANDSPDTPREQTRISEQPEWRKLLEQYVALRYVSFIRAVLARIRLIIIFLAASFSLALLSLVIYTFEPHQELIWSVTGLFIVIGVIIVRAMIQMYRDPILRMITGTKANGSLGLEFYTRIAILGVAPLLTLLATHFPSISQSLVSFLQPGLEAFK
jgi:hypothetical protein